MEGRRMTPREQLQLRALRILHDGLKHSAAAVSWARLAANTSDSWIIMDAELRYQFTLRELSLGATPETNQLTTP